MSLNTRYLIIISKNKKTKRTRKIIFFNLFLSLTYNFFLFVLYYKYIMRNLIEIRNLE